MTPDLRCGTSPAPNYEEACAAESQRDFIHKLGVVLKELRESRLWLKMLLLSKLLSQDVIDQILSEANQLCNIIGKSVVTAKQAPPKKDQKH